MKKTYNIGVDVRVSDNLEITRRLHRNISEITKKLEEESSHVLTLIDVFTPTQEELRSKLRHYCEKLIIVDPINHVQKTEGLLWRKAFYDIVSLAKKLRKGNAWTEMEKAYLSVHLSVGVGFYYHLILRLQMEYDLNLIGVIDFAYPQNQSETIHTEKRVSSTKVRTEEAKKCVTRFIHRSLICLGDLARYRLDLDPNWDPQIATRYYKMAIAVDSKYGMPHNQLGTVASNKNYGLDAVYYYMRSILCQEPFEGAEGNLKRVIIVHSFNGKEKCLTQCCVSRLLLLLQLWDNSPMNNDKINQESQLLLNDIENCLNVEKSESIDYKSAENEDNIEKYLSIYKNDETSYLTEDMIFKMVVICLMKILKLQQKESTEVHSVTAFILAVFSQLLQFVVIRLQESLLDMSMENKNYEEKKSIGNKKIIENENDTLENNEKIDNDISLRNQTVQDHSATSNVNGKIELNQNQINGRSKKSRDKSKSLLTKLRRPRNRKNSSDSDVSDVEGVVLGSSSEDINSDITETDEEDVVSDEICLSDDGLSDDLSDDERPPSKERNGNNGKIVAEQENGHANNEEKFVEENENEIITNNKISDENTEKDSKSIENIATNVSNNNDENNIYDENSPSAKTLTYVAQKEKQNLDPIKVLKVLNDEKILISIKICCDWLHGHQDIIKTCARGSKTLLNRLTTLLNLINLDSEIILKRWNKDLEIFSSPEKVNEIVKTVPLPEDIDLKGLKMFEAAYESIDWEILKRKKVTNSEETLLRALKLVKFGQYLCSIKESGVVYDEHKGLFVVSNQENNITTENHIEKSLDLEHSKGKLMQHMGKLWLKAEVRALETRLHCKLMSPYLVPDHEAFSKYMPVVKHLVYAKKFIVVVPSVVICALDELKKTSSYARESTRWLETQLQRGSRFLRAQRAHEKLPLPFIEGPIQRDKDASFYIQILECCNYLTEQAGNTGIPVVTLLTGTDDKKLILNNPKAMAKCVGVNFEHIGAFHAKWKLSIKSHG